MEAVEVWHLSVEAVAASMERTAAVMSQCALCMRESSRDVNDFDASLTCPIVASKSSGDGTAAIAAKKEFHKKTETTIV